MHFEHLKANLQLPCEVTGTEDFRWEEPYVLAVGVNRSMSGSRRPSPHTRTSTNSWTSGKAGGRSG